MQRQAHQHYERLERQQQQKQCWKVSITTVVIVEGQLNDYSGKLHIILWHSAVSAMLSCGFCRNAHIMPII